MICWGLGGFGVGLTGALKVNTKEDMAENSRMIVLWGSNIDLSAKREYQKLYDLNRKLRITAGRPS
jgi:hypothetical protein